MFEGNFTHLGLPQATGAVPTPGVQNPLNTQKPTRDKNTTKPSTYYVL